MIEIANLMLYYDDYTIIDDHYIIDDTHIIDDNQGIEVFINYLLGIRKAYNWQPVAKPNNTWEG